MLILCLDVCLIIHFFVLVLKLVLLKGTTPLWKFNNSLLRDMSFVNLVKQVIWDLKKQYAVPVYDRNNIHKIDEEELVLTINDQLFFEMILLKIRGSCISYASFKKKEQKRLENEIMSIIKHLEDNLNENNVHQLEEKKAGVDRTKKEQSRGHDSEITCKMDVYMKVIRIQNIFVILKKDILYRRQCVLFKKDDGDIIHDSNLITREVKTFYENLYASREK